MLNVIVLNFVMPSVVVRLILLSKGTKYGPDGDGFYYQILMELFSRRRGGCITAPPQNGLRVACLSTLKY
jgi:hypothetical protein